MPDLVGRDDDAASDRGAARARTGPAEPPGLSHAASRCGRLAVTTTAAGLPVGLSIDPSLLTRPPEALAAHILDLCRVAALAAGVRQRRLLAQTPGAGPVAAALGLPTERELAAAEERADRRLAAGVR